MALSPRFLVMTAMAEALQVCKVQSRSSLIDRLNMVDHLRQAMAAVLQTLFTEWLLLQLRGPQLAPRR